MISEDEKRNLISEVPISLINSSLQLKIVLIDLEGKNLSIENYSNAYFVEIIISDLINKTDYCSFLNIKTGKMVLHNNSDVPFYKGLNNTTINSISKYINWLMSKEGKQFCLDLENKLSIYL